MEARLIVERGEVVRLEMALQYRVADPLAVTAVFATEDGTSKEWTFARDLLRRGMLRSVENGLGDGWVSVWSVFAGGRPAVVLSLFGLVGHACMEVDMRPVREFLDATAAAVPYDSEVIDVDAALAQVFASAGHDLGGGPSTGC